MQPWSSEGATVGTAPLEHRRAVTPHRRVPQPPDPHERREPLPSETPKPSAEDPKAPERVQAILSGAGYRRADLDLDFFASDDMRGVRLQIDYFKAHRLLEAHEITSTIVVFGGTRI